MSFQLDCDRNSTVGVLFTLEFGVFKWGNYNNILGGYTFTPRAFSFLTVYRGENVGSAEAGVKRTKNCLQWCLTCDMQNSPLSGDPGSRCMSAMSLNYQS